MHYDLTNFHPVASHTIKHIGLIPDGSSRWAKRQGLSTEEGYLVAVNKIAEFVDLCFSENCESVSLYLSSIQNFKRPEAAIEAFCESQSYFCDNLLSDIVGKYKTRVRIAGNLTVLPVGLRNSLEKLRLNTIEHSVTRLYLCAAYNPLEEILQAVERTSKDEIFLEHLWVPEPLDILIRSGSANVLSNFLPLQAGYARFYTIDKLHPDVTIEDYLMIMREFKSLERHFGE